MPSSLYQRNPGESCAGRRRIGSTLSPEPSSKSFKIAKIEGSDESGERLWSTFLEALRTSAVRCAGRSSLDAVSHPRGGRLGPGSRARLRAVVSLRRNGHV